MQSNEEDLFWVSRDMAANFLFWGSDSESTFLLGNGCVPLAGITGQLCPFAAYGLPAPTFSCIDKQSPWPTFGDKGLILFSDWFWDQYCFAAFVGVTTVSKAESREDKTTGGKNWDFTNVFLGLETVPSSLLCHCYRVAHGFLLTVLDIRIAF